MYPFMSSLLLVFEFLIALELCIHLFNINFEASFNFLVAISFKKLMLLLTKLLVKFLGNFY